jgi:hypothetical protein
MTAATSSSVAVGFITIIMVFECLSGDPPREQYEGAAGSALGRGP